MVLLYPVPVASVFLFPSRLVLDRVVPGTPSTGLPRSEWSSCPLSCLALTASFSVPLSYQTAGTVKAEASASCSRVLGLVGTKFQAPALQSLPPGWTCREVAEL